MDLLKYIKLKKKKVEEKLDVYLPSQKRRPESIHQAMRYAVFSGGKRIRPIMSIAVFEALTNEDEKVYPVACGMELLHNYTLIHDDLPAMDNDDYRRGKPSCHKKFNEAVAILAGDALLTEGLRLFTYVEDSEVVKKLISYVTSKIGSLGVGGGQVVDIENACIEYEEDNLNEKLKKTEYINTHKTGALIEAAFVSGAIVAEANEDNIEKIEKYGYFTGYLFQIVDDILDEDGYFELMGRKKSIQKAKNLLLKAEAQLNKIKGKKDILVQIPRYIYNRINS